MARMTPMRAAMPGVVVVMMMMMVMVTLTPGILRSNVHAHVNPIMSLSVGLGCAFNGRFRHAHRGNIR